MKKLTLAKIISYVILSTLSVVLLTGCGSSETQIGTAQTSNAQTSSNSGNASGTNEGGSPNNQELISSSLADLVQDSTISQKQADTVAEFLNNRMQKRGNRAGQPEGQPPRDDSQKRGKVNGGQRPNPLSELVTKGTINQTQADKIADVLFKPMNQQN